ncbi:MAG: hypothetical protein JWN71_4359 [Xanthobacteraceae bacterium]|nr:hypothetical protein [Xanthobacteraceae bacterium]
MTRCALTVLVLIAGLAGTPAMAAEQLITSLSNHRVRVTSSFIGAELVLFGAIDEERPELIARRGYDIVVTVRGPPMAARTRRKERVLGIWVNTESRLFVNAPAYLAVLSNKPVEQIASADVLRREQVGIDNYLLPQQIGPDIGDVVRDDPFRAAFVRLRSEPGLYREDTAGVTFLSPTLFRASIPLPAEVPIGNYSVDVKLFANGQQVARNNSALEVVKVGFEQFVANAAQRHGIWYGLATAAMALLTGWFASVVFRRD